MTQGPGLEIKTKVAAHMLCFVLQAILSPLPAGILTEQGKAQETMLWRAYQDERGTGLSPSASLAPAALQEHPVSALV